MGRRLKRLKLKFCIYKTQLQSLPPPAPPSLLGASTLSITDWRLGGKREGGRGRERREGEKRGGGEGDSTYLLCIRPWGLEREGERRWVEGERRGKRDSESTYLLCIRALELEREHRGEEREILSTYLLL